MKNEIVKVNRPVYSKGYAMATSDEVKEVKGVSLDKPLRCVLTTLTNAETHQERYEVELDLLSELLTKLKDHPEYYKVNKEPVVFDEITSNKGQFLLSYIVDDLVDESKYIATLEFTAVEDRTNY